MAWALDTSLDVICLTVGSVCKLHSPFAAPSSPHGLSSKGSVGEWQAVSSVPMSCHGVKMWRADMRRDIAAHLQLPLGLTTSLQLCKNKLVWDVVSSRTASDRLALHSGDDHVTMYSVPCFILMNYMPLPIKSYYCFKTWYSASPTKGLFLGVISFLNDVQLPISTS